MSFREETLHCDLCVVGGGMAGIGAAVSAARAGISVVLVQDRPMLGGNASSEIRMWISGAKGEGNRESGLLEEIELRNFHRNPYKNYSIWDSILWETVKAERNITLLLNTTCMDGVMDGSRIKSIRCWQMTTQKFYIIESKLFADTSGDSILAPISGAEYMEGREPRKEWDESFGPDTEDSCTMGNSILLTLRECGEERRFIAPEWATRISPEELLGRFPDLTKASENFWYLELGGKRDTIGDAEEIRDDLLGLVYGFADWVKNGPEMKEKSRNYDVSWIGMHPGKRESRRYIGDYVMNEHDLLTDIRKPDCIAYGGWPMDDHNPGGFFHEGHPNINHPAESPYHIPYRSIYSANIDNLFFAGRNISVTHAAFSSTRVMGTCILLGQAVGFASAIAVREDCSPRMVGKKYIGTLQRMLMDADCWLPGIPRTPSSAALRADWDITEEEKAELLNGTERTVGGRRNALTVGTGEGFSCRLRSPLDSDGVRLVFDSDLDRKTVPQDDLFRNMGANELRSYEPVTVPVTLARDFDVEFTFSDGRTERKEIRDNIRRLVMVEAGEGSVESVSFRLLRSWGNERINIYSFDFL